MKQTASLCFRSIVVFLSLMALSCSQPIFVSDSTPRTLTGGNTLYLTNAAVASVTPSGQTLQTSGTSTTGWQPTTSITTTTKYWYSGVESASIAAGTWQVVLWTNNPGTSNVTVSLALTSSDGTSVTSLGSASANVGSTGTGNHATTFNISVAAKTLSSQRVRLSIVKSSGVDSTMAYNGNDFPSRIIYPAATTSTSGSTSTVDNADTYTPGTGYNLVWSDEFNGTALDTTVWNYDVGAGGWGNAELEYYTSGTNNISFVPGDNANKYLAITAKKESYKGSAYTSARINTMGKKTFTFGSGKTVKYAARIKVPTALTGGVWPAFWMLGNNFSSAGWPYCGEIDIMEAGANGTPATQVSGTLHWGPNSSTHYMYGLSTNASSNLGNSFHIFEATVNDTQIKIYLDGVQYFVMNNDVSSGSYYYFKHDFFFLLNLAVGGNFPWPVTATFPQTMYVDWLRVYSN